MNVKKILIVLLIETILIILLAGLELLNDHTLSLLDVMMMVKK